MRTVASLLVVAMMVLECSSPRGAPKEIMIDDSQTDTPKNTLVIFYSRSGNTRRVARDLATRLDADIEEVIARDDFSGFFGMLRALRAAFREQPVAIVEPKRRPGDYQMVILGTPVWGGAASLPARTYIDRFKTEFRQVAYFFTAKGAKTEDVAPKIEALAGLKAKAVLGYTSAELAPSSRGAYEVKLSAFLDALK